MVFALEFVRRLPLGTGMPEKTVLGITLPRQHCQTTGQFMPVTVVNVVLGFIATRMAIIRLICRRDVFPWYRQTQSLESASDLSVMT
jgi:hypothetical protein